MADKNIRQEEEECLKFLDISGDDLNVKEEIKKCYNYIVSNYLEEKLKKILPKEINEEEKNAVMNQLPNNIKEIIENLNSSYQILTDSMNINDFIKVKRVKDIQFKSEIIKGFAMTKGAYSKIKRINKNDTKILILDFDLNEHEIKDPFEKENSKEKKKNEEKEKKNDNIKMESFWADDIYEKIESLNVNVILINKGIDNRLLEKLEKSKIIAINIKSLSLKHIARCIKCKAISSLEEFEQYFSNKENKEDDKNKKLNICGSCFFEIVNIKKFSEEKSESVICFNNIEDYKPEIFEKIIYRPKFKLMKFESKNNDYFRTLLLRSSSQVLLDNIKKALKEEIFITVRDFFLQQKILHFLFCKVEFVLPQKEPEQEKKLNKSNINDKTNNIDNKNNAKINTGPKQVRTIRRKMEQQNEKEKLKDLPSDNKDNNKSIKKNPSQISKVNNITPIINMKIEQNLPPSPQISAKNKQVSSISKSNFAPEPTINKQDSISSKDKNNIFPQLKESNDKSKSKPSPIMRESFSNFNESCRNSKSNLCDETLDGETSIFNIETNITDDKTIKLNSNIFYKNDLYLMQQEETSLVQEQSNNYLFGFDISIIKKNKENRTNLNLLKLKMCKSDKNYNKQKTDIAIDDTTNEEFKLKIKNENELLKKLNFVCGNPENVDLIFYESNIKAQNDKQFGKFIIQMLVDQYNECDKCHNEMSNHFYYLYNSNYKRIKLSYITKADLHLKFIIEYILSKDKNFKLMRKELIIGEEIDYNIDIYSYGYCKKCKKIVTPLIKMPKDFFSYSTAEFFKHLLNNSKISNRNKIEFNLINANKDSTKNDYFTKECSHSSFQDISRFFVTTYGCLKFEVEDLEMYKILSVQQIPDKERKMTTILEIQNNKTKVDSRFEPFFKITDFIGNKLKNEKEEFEKFIFTNKEKLIEISDEKFIESLINLLSDIIDYFLDDSTKEPSTNKKEEEEKSDEKNESSPSSLKVSKPSSNESKELSPKFKLQISNISEINIDGIKEVGLNKKIAFRVAQFKVLYNKIRLLIYKIKLFIALMNVLSPNDKDKEKKENNNEEEEKKNPLKKNLEEDNIDAYSEADENKILKSPLQANLEKLKNDTKAKSQSQPLKIPPKFEIPKQTNLENFFKLLIENYISLDTNNQDINKNIDIAFENNPEYIKMLDTIIFYEDKQNDFSSIIKNNDLSSIVSFGISSLVYKNFLRDKTTLLEKDESNKISNINSTPSIQTEKDKDINNQINLDQDLYDSLFIFEKNNTKLESEILSGETKSLAIEIKSINQEQLYPTENSIRKATISMQAKVAKGVALSPMPFSPGGNKTNPIEEQTIEKILSMIEDKILFFFNKIEGLKNELLEKIKTEIRIKKSINDIYTAIKNIKAEFSLNSNIQVNKENNTTLTEKDKKDLVNNEKKKDIAVNFFLSTEDQIKKSKNSFSVKTNKNNQNSGIQDNIGEESEENLNFNLIELIGNLFFYEDKIPKSEIELTIYFPIQFEALRIAYCSTYEDLVKSIMKSAIWKNVSGGKSKAKFYKTNDEKYLFKSIKENEFNMFLEMAINYFHHMDEYLFHKMPSLLMKILGVYKIIIKKEEKGIINKETYYLMLMENLNYGLNFDKGNIISYDLKGSIMNRYVTKSNLKEKSNIVLYDNNFKEDFNNEPIPLKKNLYDLLIISVHNDTIFLNNMGVVDYSLLLHIYSDKENKINYIRIGIIDYIRKYTWDKQLEHYIKIFINRFVVPTIINPSAYKNRFEEAIQDYFICI